MARRTVTASELAMILQDPNQRVRLTSGAPELGLAAGTQLTPNIRQQSGFLSGIKDVPILGAITSPFRKGIDFGRELFGTIKGLATGDTDEELFQPMFTSTDEFQGMLESPLTEAAKIAAATGAFAVPGGATFTSGLGRGALAGGLGGYGTSLPGEELQGLLSGALTGGAIGGAVGGITGRLAKPQFDDVIQGRMDRALQDAGTPGAGTPGRGLSIDRTGGVGNVADEIEYIMGQEVGGQLPDEALRRLSALDEVLTGADKAQVSPLLNQYTDDIAQLGDDIDIDNWLTRTGQKMQRESAGLKLQKTPTGYSKGSTLYGDVKQITGRYGKDVTDEGIDHAFKQLSSGLNKGIGESSVVAHSDDIIQEAAENLSLNFDISQKKALDLIMADINRAEVTGALDAQSLAGLKAFTQKSAINAEKIMERGSNVSNKTASMASINEVADRVLKGGLDDASREIYKDMRTLYEAAPDIISKADKAGHITIFDTKIPSFGIPQKVQGSVGNILEKTGKTVQGGIPGIKAGVPQAAKQGTLKALQGFGRAAPVVGGMSAMDVLSQAQSEDLIQQLGQPQQQPDVVSDLGGYTQPQQGITFMDALQMAQQYFPGGSESEILSTAKWIMDSENAGVGGGTADMTASERLLLSQGDTAELQLNQIEQMISSQAGEFGPLVGWQTSLPWATDEKAIKAELDTAAQTIGRFLEGGKLTDKDIERYKRDIIPSINDTPELAQIKLQKLRTLIQNQKQSIMMNAGTGGSTPDIQEDYGDLGYLFN